ncbi:MAG: phthalate 4,5-dioxygenase [Chloroflexi bacterium]|nr:phthalate 4,5-dioxygenase [Chloroflexota bacterium]
MGELLRRYWQPVALAEELPAGGAPVPVQAMGEDLVLFRDDKGQIGLLGLHCSHRGADLSYGRLEDEGLRCIYHGWLYDVRGRCLEQPGEPSGSTFNERIRHGAYPCQERGGLILAYMGPGEAPLLPDYEFLSAPADHRTVTKVFHECNFQQSSEGNIDQAHVSFLHRVARDGGDMNYLVEDTSPSLDPEETDYGLRIYSVRRVEGDKQFVKISNFVMPNFAAVPGGGRGDGYQVNWHVPIDDTHHWKFVYTYRRNTPIGPPSPHGTRAEVDSQYHLIRNKGNRYLQDRDEMKSKSFVGLAVGFNAQDACATEGAGPIQDRTDEHIAYTDRVISASRALLFRAMRDVEEGRDPQHVIRDPAANGPPEILVRTDVILGDVPWREHWRQSAPLRLPDN